MKTLVLVVMQLAASGADGYYTHRALSLPMHHEYDPISQPFMHSTGSQVAYWTVLTGLKIVVPLELRHRRHGRLADAVAVYGIADGTFGAAFSATHQ